MRPRRIAFVTALTLAAAAASVPASAYMIVGSRAAFDSMGPYVSADWSAFGPPGTVISTPDSRTYTMPGPGMDMITVASSQGQLAVHQESTDFTGDFMPGDYLLTDAGSQSDSFIVDFTAPVRGFGFQIEPDYIRGPWTGTVVVHGSSVWSVPIGGMAGNAEDGSAPFFGYISNTADISYVTISVDQTDPNLPSAAGAIAINGMDVLVPEPSSLALAGTALFLLFVGFVGRSRRKA